MKNLTAITTIGLCAAVGLAFGIPSSQADELAKANDARAAATLQETKKRGKKVGTIHFVQRGDEVTMSGSFRMLPPGKHGLHIRATDSCSRRAGKHFNPTDTRHGPPESSRRHVGDLGNIDVGKDGKATFSMTTDSFTVEKGHSTVVGKSIVITRDADNGKSQPDGDAGPAIACAVIAKKKT